MPKNDGTSSALRTRLKRGMQVALEIIIIGYLVYYFSRQAEKLERVLNLRVIDAAALIGLGLAGNLIRSWELKYLVRKLGGRIPYWQSASLTMGCTLLNYLPMNAGMIVKARVLKKHVGVQYAHFVSLMTGQLLATIAGGAVLGLVVLGASWNVAGPGQWHVAAILAAALVCCVLAFHVPASWVPEGKGWVRTALRDFLQGLGYIRHQRTGLAILFCFANVKLLLLGWRFWICFAVLGAEVTFLGCVILAVLAAFTML
ncbi:MAG: lysylphosphatidylglycerol synthase domain-containing protein, partial [Phycisphaerae bacterium]